MPQQGTETQEKIRMVDILQNVTFNGIPDYALSCYSSLQSVYFKNGVTDTGIREDTSVSVNQKSTTSSAAVSRFTPSSSVDSCCGCDCDIIETTSCIDNEVCNIEACIAEGHKMEEENSYRPTILTIQYYLIVLLCGFELFFNSGVCFFLMEKRRIWAPGHTNLPLLIDIVECGFLTALFLSFSGTMIVLVQGDFTWFLPGCIALLISTLIYIADIYL